MELLKKILVFIKDFAKGTLYPGFAIGFMLLIAAALIYFQPFDYFSDQAVIPKDPQRLNAKQAWRLFRLGLEILAACGVVFVLINGGETWWRGRPKKSPDAVSEPAAAAEPPKEAA